MKMPSEVSMKVQRVAGALSRVLIWNVNQSASGVFLLSRMVFFFLAGRRGTYQIENIMFPSIS